MIIKPKYLQVVMGANSISRVQNKVFERESPNQ